MYEYNTVKERLILKEYGRNIQMLVQQLETVEDQEERNKRAESITQLMRQLNPKIKDISEIEQKLWDDIHIISDFNLEITGPFPVPEKEILHKKPNRVEYNMNAVTFKHFGRNIELLIDNAVSIEDPEKQEAAVIRIGKLMKTFFYLYSKDALDNNVIYENIRALSKGKLHINMRKVNELNLFGSPRKEGGGRDRSRRDQDNRSRNRRSSKRRRN